LKTKLTLLRNRSFTGKLFAYETRYVSVDPILDPEGIEY